MKGEDACCWCCWLDAAASDAYVASPWRRCPPPTRAYDILAVQWKRGSKVRVSFFLGGGGQKQLTFCFARKNAPRSCAFSFSTFSHTKRAAEHDGGAPCKQTATLSVSLCDVVYIHLTTSLLAYPAVTTRHRSVDDTFSRHAKNDSGVISCRL